MKRSPMPRRKKPMERTGPPKRRTPMPPRREPMQSRRVPAKVARLRPANGRATSQHRRVRKAVYDRDQRRCRLRGVASAGPCFGPLTVHHLRKQAHRGPFTVRNLLTLCWGHNGWVETSPAADLVYHWGLVIRHGGHHVEAWALMQLAGLVSWWWDGTPATDPQPCED